MSKQRMFIGLIPILITGMITGQAGAQTVPHSGPLAFPVPYFGTHTLGDPPIVYPPPNAKPVDPLKYWRSQIIFGRGNGAGATVIIAPPGYCQTAWPYAPYNYGWLPYYQYRGFSIGGGYYGTIPLGFGGVYQARSTARYEVAPPRKQEEVVTTEARNQAENRALSSYYLAKPLTDTKIQAAMADIEKAWQTNSSDLLTKYIDPNSSIQVEVQGSEPYQLSGAEYLQRTKAALKSMKTLAFHLDKVKDAGNGDWVVSGYHRFEMPDGKPAELKTEFTLHLSGDVVTIVSEKVSPE